jgi:hypothetical protein
MKGSTFKKQKLKASINVTKLKLLLLSQDGIEVSMWNL